MASRLLADWALWGKEPRSTSGYRILAACPPDRGDEFNTAILHWSPGTPTPGDRLPWITIGCGRTPDGTGTVGVFLLDDTPAVDHTHRTIYRISHFAVPVADAGAAGVGWYGLARAALDAAGRLTETGAAPAELVLDADDLLLTRVGRQVTARVSKGTHWLAAAAAHLLDGPVAVTGDHYEALELLEVLDCVAALLPYGMRHSLSAATSTSSGSEVPMRLYWGTDDSPGVASLAWNGELPDLGALSAPARTYHDLLVGNWTQHGGPAVLRHLAEAREPLDVTAPDAHARAVDVLTRLDPGLATVQEVREGREVDRERIDLALRRPGIDPGSVAVLAGRRIAEGSGDMGALAAHLGAPEVSQPVRARLIEDLLAGRTDAARAAFESLREATPDTRAGLRPLDEVLAFVVTEILDHSAQDGPEPVTGQLLPSVAPFTEGTMNDFTLSLLRTVPGLADRLLQALYAGPDPAGPVLAWLRWLGDGAAPEAEGSPELAPLSRLLSLGACPPEVDRKWAEHHPETAARLLAAAAACGHAHPLLREPELFHGLVACVARSAGADPAGDPAQELLRRALDRSPGPVQPDSAARWDVLCALAGLPPTGFLTLATLPELPGSGGTNGRVGAYAAVLSAALESRPLRRHRESVAELLLQDLLSVDTETGAGPDQAARDLTHHLLDGREPYARIVREAVDRLATGTPHWKETEADQRWLARLAQRLPSLRPALAVRAVHRAAAHAGGTREECRSLAAGAYEARRAGAGDDALCAALAPWAARAEPGGRILALLDAYHRTWESYTGRGRADEERDHLELAFAHGAAPDAWLDYRDHAVRELSARRADCTLKIDALQSERSQCDREIDRLRRLDHATAHARART
ncbi:hypothetical protein [Streptomyces tropicalis]|uniref:Uncharacterized protein n=1 Tax=Streptomyces tropicalis TaxID=3034234 RepID=A0ABT6AC23_9ACTN|nr:hypothetical protein [Streptomyces tropicalis]MDF3301355.1 hypothetical protein [Streptomyces tropicalis]